MLYAIAYEPSGRRIYITLIPQMECDSIDLIILRPEDQDLGDKDLIRPSPLKKLYSKLPPGIVLQNQKDNRHALLEKVEDRGRYLSIEGRIIRRDGGLKKKRQHLYQLAQEWIPMTYEETLQFCMDCKHLSAKIRTETGGHLYCSNHQKELGIVGRFGSKEEYPKANKTDCYEGDLSI